MDYVGKICPFCKTKLQQGDDIVVCSACAMPHHKDCWVENQGCTTFGCSGTISGVDQTPAEAPQYIFCTKCGAKNNGNDLFCGNCGTALASVSSGTAHSQQHYSAYAGAAQNNMWQTPQTPISGTQQNGWNVQQNQETDFRQNVPTNTQQSTAYNSAQNSAWGNPSGAWGFGQDENSTYEQREANDYYLFIRENFQYYYSKFNLFKLNNSQVSWNWASFFFPSYWFVYRKMYGIGFAVGTVALLSLFVYPLTFIINIGIRVFAGMMGNYFYYNYCNRQTGAALSMCNPEKQFFFAKRGGTNIGGAVLFAVVFGVVLSIISTALTRGGY